MADNRRSSTGLIVLAVFIIALGVFLWALFNFLGSVNRAETASVTTTTPTVGTTFTPISRATDTPIAPTATPTRVQPSPTAILPTATSTRAAPSPTATAPRVAPSPTLIAPAPVALTKQTYSTLTIQSAVTDRPAASHADLNLKLRGFAPFKSDLELMDLEGATDGAAPQLSSLLTGSRDPVVKAVYRVNNWDWGCNCKAKPIDDPDVTLVGFGVTPGEPIHVPHANIDIGNKNQVMVLYADADSITLVYTRNDNVTQGYIVHVAGVAIEPDLLALYQQLNSAGRASLPALKEYQVLGVAPTNEIRIAVRDTGAFMDPRSRKDWWRDKPKPQLPPSMMKPRP
ncbi:MAG: hypothetical protein HY868_02325 [Chloroflexi bacterium]|nr:hypothetical protein [Chloroflexota bacterium]